jgi:peptidyl-prolyl cis-trans isomerase B (cyclophilin B)
MLTRTFAAFAAVSVLTVAAGCSDDTGKDDDVSAGDPGASQATESGAPHEGACAYPTDPLGPARDVTPPLADPEVTGKVSVVVKTTVGDLNFVLDAKKAPCTVNSFLSLAEQDYYDGTECHRLSAVQGFSMLQCGDPTATGSGGPGYTIPDELSGNETYPAGTLAMAKRQLPNSGGGQFFLVFGDTGLDPDYTVFGKMDASTIRILQGVGAKGHDNSYGDGTGRPNQRVVFQDVVVR